MLELKDRIDKNIEIDEKYDTPITNTYLEAVNGLMSLGYTKLEIERIIKSIDTTKLDVEDIIREVLKRLSKN